MSSSNAPYLKQNDRGQWEIRWTEDRRSIRRSTKTDDLAAAERKLAEFIMERQAGPAVTVPQILDAYVDHLRAKGKQSAERRGYISKNLKRHFAGPVSEITIDSLEAYGRARKRGEIGVRCTSDGTLRHELSTLGTALTHAARTKLIQRSDIPYIPLPEAPPPKDLWFDEAESQQILATANVQLADDPLHKGALFVWIAMETASRKRAVEELRWSQVDLQAGLIMLNPPGRRQTSKRRPTVPISSALLPVLRRARAAATGELVLGNSSSVERPFATLCKAAYEATRNEKFLKATPHVLRHTWATLAARAGVSLFEIAGVLGDDIATVQRVYAHHCPDFLRAAVDFRLSGTVRNQPTAGIST